MKLPSSLFDDPATPSTRRPDPDSDPKNAKLLLTEDYFAPKGVWRPRQSKRPGVAGEPSKPSYLYVFVHAHQNRLKIGRSDKPLRRLSNLPEVNDIDLQQSFRLQLPDRRRACEVESMLQRALAGHRLRLTWNNSSSLRHSQDISWDGQTEWFSLSGMRYILDLLRALPKAAGGQDAQLETLKGLPYVSEVSTPYANKAEPLQQEAQKYNLRQLDHICAALMQIKRHLKIGWKEYKPDESTQSPNGGILRVHGYKTWWDLENFESVKGITDHALWNLQTGRHANEPNRVCRRTNECVGMYRETPSVSGLVALIRFAGDNPQDLELVFNPPNLVGEVPGGIELNRR